MYICREFLFSLLKGKYKKLSGNKSKHIRYSSITTTPTKPSHLHILSTHNLLQITSQNYRTTFSLAAHKQQNNDTQRSPF